jgi:hypothetical protein
MSCRAPRIDFSVLIAGVFLIGCAVSAPIAKVGDAQPALQAPTDRHTEAIRVDRPMVVGFFPYFTQADIDADEGLQSALEHFRYAIEDTAECLEASAIPVKAVYAESIVFENGDRRSEVDLRELSNESVGCAFVAPDKDTRFVHAWAGPSSLILLCPAAASLYFSVPQCCPPGWKCCPDGNVIGDEYPCPG